MRTSTSYIVIHCAATPPKMDVDISTIAEWHKERGFKTVGYHYFIKRDGTRQTGRPIHDIGAHVVGFNHCSVGVCMAGGVAADAKTPENNFTKQQWAALAVTLRELHEEFPLAVIVGHRDLDPGKACPSFSVAEYIDTLELGKDKPNLSPKV